MFALVSCELKRLSFALLPSRLAWTICNGKFVWDDVNAVDAFDKFVCCCCTVGCPTACDEIMGAGDWIIWCSCSVLWVGVDVWGPNLLRKKNESWKMEVVKIFFCFFSWGCWYGTGFGICGLDSSNQLAKCRWRSYSIVRCCSISVSFIASVMSFPLPFSSSFSLALNFRFIVFQFEANKAQFLLLFLRLWRAHLISADRC